MGRQHHGIKIAVVESAFLHNLHAVRKQYTVQPSAAVEGTFTNDPGALRHLIYPILINAGIIDQPPFLLFKQHPILHFQHRMAFRHPNVPQFPAGCKNIVPQNGQAVRQRNGFQRPAKAEGTFIHFLQSFRKPDVPQVGTQHKGHDPHLLHRIGQHHVFQAFTEAECHGAYFLHALGNQNGFQRRAMRKCTVAQNS